MSDQITCDQITSDQITSDQNTSDQDQIIPDSYIVILNSGTSSDELKEHIEKVRDEQKRHSSEALAPTPSDGKDTTEPIIRHIFDSKQMKGYSGNFDRVVIDQIRALPDVKYVECNYFGTMDELISEETTQWGLGSISHGNGIGFKAAGPPVKYNYRHHTTNENVRLAYVYVLDTGVLIGHTEFGGRAAHGTNVLPEDDDSTDLNGHGTRVAGIIAGATCGVARAARIIAVKVTKGVDGRSDDAIAGLVWVMQDSYNHKRRTESVVNMSIGYPLSQTLNDKVSEAVGVGITVIASAGNLAEKVKRSPAIAPDSFTVGATEIVNNVLYRWGARPKKGKYSKGRITFNSLLASNYGPAVNIFAPGANIKSCTIGPNNNYTTASGTSYAAPHVAGVAAYLISREAALITPALVTARIHGFATNGIVQNRGDGSPNLSLFNGSVAVVP